MEKLPDRVSADLRRHLQSQENGFRFPPNEKHIERAREEITDAILNGLGWKGHTFGSILGDYLNVPGPEMDQRCEIIAGHMQATTEAGRAECRKWMRDLTENYIRDQWIEDRAAQLASV